MTEEHPATSTNKLDDPERIKIALDIIKRIDSYIVSTNTKSAVCLTYCAAVIAASVFLLRSASDLQISSINIWPLSILCLSFLAVLISAFRAICLAFRVIFPNTSSTPNNKSNYSSVFFYGDISSVSEKSYISKFREISQREITNDLLAQIHAASDVASKKMQLLKSMTKAVYVNLGFFFLILIIISTQAITKGL